MNRDDRKEFRDQIEQLYPRLHRAMSAYLAGTPVEPEDILQETFLKAYKNLDQFREESGFYTWLYSIARNLSIDEFRKRKHEKNRSPVPVEEFELTSDRFLSDAEREEVLLLRKAISQLPELLRAVVVMKSIDGMSYPEIAKITGVNEQTLKNRMFRARKKLAETLNRMGVDKP